MLPNGGGNRVLREELALPGCNLALVRGDPKKGGDVCSAKPPGCQYGTRLLPRPTMGAEFGRRVMGPLWPDLDAVDFDEEPDNDLDLQRRLIEKAARNRADDGVDPDA